uniref:Uncharacterized protein n=1 Tax=Triticum urartu TaxID=4572 RepID=A0A8R7TM26_TRIUA
MLFTHRKLRNVGHAFCPLTIFYECTGVVILSETRATTTYKIASIQRIHDLVLWNIHIS